MIHAQPLQFRGNPGDFSNSLHDDGYLLSQITSESCQYARHPAFRGCPEWNTASPTIINIRRSPEGGARDWPPPGWKPVFLWPEKETLSDTEPANPSPITLSVIGQIIILGLPVYYGHVYQLSQELCTPKPRKMPISSIAVILWSPE